MNFPSKLKSVFFLSLMIMVFSSFMQVQADVSSTLVRQCDGARIEQISWSNSYRQAMYPYEWKTETGSRLQLVVDGQDQKNYFLSHAMIYANSKGEVILPVLQGIANSSDYKDETSAFRNDGRVIFVKPQGNTVSVESFRTSQPTGGIYVQQEMVAAYTLVNCR